MPLGALLGYPARVERIQLIHWNEGEARQRVRELRAAGLRVEYELDAAAALRLAGEDPPAAAVIDLARLPSHGREMGWALRRKKATRAVVLVFVGGDPAKVARIRSELPDATYTDWERLGSALEHALRRPPAEPVVPESKTRQKPLAGKLGWKPGTKLALVGAPSGFEARLGPTPEGARLVRGARGAADLVLGFVRSERELRTALPRWRELALAGTRLWIAWPKKGASVATDLTQARVRALPQPLGLVDYKICALDDDWSGMCFAPRRGGRPTRAVGP